jgi:hypothetical protein
MHDTGAALGDPAAVLGTRQAEPVAQYPEQRRVLGKVKFTGLAIDGQSNHRTSGFCIEGRATARRRPHSSCQVLSERKHYRFAARAEGFNPDISSISREGAKTRRKPSAWTDSPM